jgi:hypothetical protein
MKLLVTESNSLVNKKKKRSTNAKRTPNTKWKTQKVKRHQLPIQRRATPKL